MPHSPCFTEYPIDLIRLIFESYCAVFTCDEISRDLDDTEAFLDVRYSVLAHFDDEVFSRALRILDYGCGAGSSSVALSRLFPLAQITGVDFVPSLLEIARSRTSHYGIHDMQFRQVPASGDIGNLGHDFDLAFETLFTSICCRMNVPACSQAFGLR